MIGGAFGGDPRLGWSEDDRIPVRVHQPFGGAGGVQVVVEDAVGGGAPLLLAVGGTGEVVGVGVQQVMERVPARDGFGEQVGVGELGQQRTYFGDGEAGE